MGFEGVAAPLRMVQQTRIVLAAAASQNNAQIGRDLGLHVDTVVAGVKALACSPPPSMGGGPPTRS